MNVLCADSMRMCVNGLRRQLVCLRHLSSCGAEMAVLM